MHATHLTEMFQAFRKILAEELEKRFHTSTTPDNVTLLSLMFDPYLDTSKETGIFSGSSAAQSLMEGEYRRCLIRRGIKLAQRVAGAAAPAPGPAPTIPSTPSWEKALAIPRAAAPAPSDGASSSTSSSTTRLPIATLPKPAAKRAASVLSLVSQPSSKALAIPARPEISEMEKKVEDEMSKFYAICGGILAEGDRSRFVKGGIFDQKEFFYEHRHDLPIHYNAFVGEVGTMKAASANIESVFSGVGMMLQKATTMGAELVADYAILHYNWLYSWLEPTDKEIEDAYNEAYGPEPHESDLEKEEGTSSDEESDSEEESVDEDDGG